MDWPTRLLAGDAYHTDEEQDTEATRVMNHATRQLEQVRQIGRLLLLAHGLSQLAAVLVAVFLICGSLDYVLRLPGWFRLGISVSVGLVAVAWLVRRLSSVLRFSPPLSTLALRAERLYPQLTGILASGVEFATSKTEPGESDVAQVMAQHSIARAQQELEHVSLRRLVKPGRTLWTVGAASAVLLLLGSIVIAVPGASGLAARRWLDPLGPAQWPNRTRVRSLIGERVWASDTPLRLRAVVERGYSQGMRIWAVYRVVEPAGGHSQWQSLLMSQQAQSPDHPNSHQPGSSRGFFERLVDVTDKLPSQAQPETPRRVEFYFLAGDDRTAPQTLRLVARPAVKSVTAVIEPPAYASGLVQTQRHRLDQQTSQLATTDALVGSTVNMQITFNKPIDEPKEGWASFLPGLAGHTDTPVVIAADDRRLEGAVAIVKSFVLEKTVQTPIRITDQHGLSNLSERLYRISATHDLTPAVSMVQPAVDEAVLPSALIPARAVAQDDVGLDSLAIEAQIETGHRSDDRSLVSKHVLTEVSGRQPRLSTGHPIDLRSLNLNPGDQVLLTAVARDVFEIDGRRHDSSHSPPRRLQVIDVATLIGELRTELAGVRQQAIRLEAQQRGLLELPADASVSGQQQLTVYLGAQRTQIAAVRQRIRRNRLNPDQGGRLRELTRRASAISQQAERSSQIAERLLGQSPDRQAASDVQQEVTRFLAELIELLDQGRDALALRRQLQQLKVMQEELARRTRRLMPLTLGWSVDQLGRAQRQQLKDLTDRQSGLAKLAGATLKRMQATSDALSRQGDSPDDQASSAVLSEAVSVARRQGLVSVLQRAADKAQQNQLSDAGNDQAVALDLVEKMLAELDQIDQRHQAILRRRLIQLSDAVSRLIKQQKLQLGRLEQVSQTSGLDIPLEALRRRTMAVAQRAYANSQSEPAGTLLEKAAQQHAVAIPALRQSERQTAHAAQRQALTHMTDALESIQKLKQAARTSQVLAQRQELQKAYEKLAQEQEVLREQTTGLVGPGPLSRRQRAASLSIGHRQADLNTAARELLGQVQQAMVFTYLHQQLDQDCAVVVSRLRRAKPDSDVLDRQDQIAATLRQMAQALATEPLDRPFVSGGGGGGGGGASGMALVTPVAELKLLRAMQQLVYGGTKRADRFKPAGDTTGVKEILRKLATRQRELANLGHRLIQQMQRSRRRPPNQVDEGKTSK